MSLLGDFGGYLYGRCPMITLHTKRKMPLSKMDHFIGCKNPNVASLFFKDIVRPFGIPILIIFHRDVKSNKLDTALDFSSSHRP